MDTTTTRKARRSTCHYCSQVIVEKESPSDFVAVYGYDGLAWVSKKDGRGLCYSHDSGDGRLNSEVAHCTTKEWYSGS